MQIPKIRQGSYSELSGTTRRWSRRCWRWSSRRMCAASRRARRQLVESLGLRYPEARSAASVRRWMSTSTLPHATVENSYPYVFFDAKIERVRDGRRIVDKALMIAHGVHETDRREILSIDVGEAETEAFWTASQGSGQARPDRRAARDLRRARWSRGDDGEGRSAAPGSAARCTSQRCFGHARKDQRGLLGALIRRLQRRLARPGP